MRQILSIVILLVFLSGCKKEKEDTGPEGEITLSSQSFLDITYYSFGYSFEKANFIKTIGSAEIIDIYLVEISSITGNLTGVQFQTKEIPDSTYGFYLNGTFQTAGEAENFYNSYTKAVAPQYQTLTDPVAINQVWTFRTYKKNYVKILVKDLRTIYTGNTADYIEVDIKYFIQRNGSDDLSK